MKDLEAKLNEMNSTGLLQYADYSYLFDGVQELQAENAALTERLKNAVELPCGWLDCLKLLTAAAISYADIVKIIRKEMITNKEYAALYTQIPLVQGSFFTFDLEYLSASEININEIAGFKDLLKIMIHTKSAAEARLAELKGETK